MTTPVYGCHNRKPYKDEVVVYGEPLRSGGHVFPVIALSIPFTMTRDCQYTKTYLGQKDPKCAGCSWRVEIPVVEERDFFVFRNWKEGDDTATNMFQVSMPITRSEADAYIEARKDSSYRYFMMRLVKD